MFSLRTSLDHWRSGQGSLSELPKKTDLQVFDNPAIFQSSRKVEEGFEVWVGEGTDPSSATQKLEVRLGKTRAFDEFDGIRITFIAHAAKPRLIISRTIGGNSPLYIATNGSRFHASWNFEEVVAVIDSPKPNADICRLVLEYGVGQTREQIIQGMFALWPGEKATFDEDGLSFAICEDIQVALPAPLSDRGRATDAFIEVVASVMQSRLTRSTRPLLEFSGGMDSTCVALAASTIRSPLECYGLIQPGAVGRQQRTRCRELIELLGLTDHTGDSSAVLPLDTLSCDECRITPYDDCYRMSIMSAFEANDLGTVDLVISGLGGDELAKEHTFWRYEWEVPGHASRSAMVSSMCNFDLFMKRGVWPLNPLANPRVVHLCRSLPVSLLKNRQFNRLAIARAGLSDGYMSPRYHETFANVLLMQSLECDVDNIFEYSVLADFGIFDPSTLLSEIYEATELGLSIKLVGKIFYTAKLETVLKKYVN